jgi:hypothetical protein
MYVVITETVLGLYAPPPDCAVIRVCCENTIVDYHHFVDVLHMSYEHVLLLDANVWMHVVDSHSVVKTRDYQLLPHNVTHVHRNAISAYLLLVPEQDHFVLVACYQHAAQHQAHTDWLLVVG